MSLDGPRDALLREKSNEVTASLLSRKRKLRELYRVTVSCTASLNAGYQPKVEDFVYSEPDENESRFLDENDQTEGRRFNDATLPFPAVVTDQHPPLPATLPFQTSNKPTFPSLSTSSPSSVVGAPSLEDQLRAASASPSVATQTPPAAPLQSDATHVSPRVKIQSQAASPAVEEKTAIKAQPEAPHPESPLSKAPAVQDLSSNNADSDGPSVDPAAIAPPDVEDVDAMTPLDGSLPVSGREGKAKAPQVVHLPSKEVQEARLQDTERKLEKAAEKERREDERLTIPPTNATVEVSSPSSTIGPYSQATPHAPHHSPDTSPDTESFDEHVHSQGASDDILDPAAQLIKEDHERALQKRMREARERARAREEDSPTPDIEKQLENDQAIRLARDGKDRLSEPQSGPGFNSITKAANEVVKGVVAEHDETIETSVVHDHAADSLPTPTMTAPESATLDGEFTSSNLEQQRTVPMAADHPTPPADADIEMDDVPSTTQRATSPQPPPSRTERMTTRVSSGALRRKSVSEIIGDKITSKTILTPHSSNLSTSVSPPRPKTSDRKSREVSTVVFAKKTPTRSAKALQSYNEDYASLQGASEDSSRDYLEGLFKYQAHHPPRSVPLQDLVSSARKTVSTAGTLAMIREHQDYKILKRVYQLQNANRWSLRQLQKAVEPERPFTHQDQLLLEMKWMQTDFREERKWKRSLATTFAEWCAEYVNSDPAERAMLRVKSYIPKSARRASNEDEDMNDAPTPDLVQSGANETESESYADEDELLTPLNANPPAGLFSLGFNDVVMKIERTPASDTMFRELPFYEPMLEGASDTSAFSLSDPPILSVSKFVTGKLVSQIRGPPRKRSRYDYDSEDEPSSPPSRSGTSAEHSMPSTPGRRLFCRNDLPPEMTDVALFNAENKHVRDRLQAAHQFRPPTEFNMPTVAFFENRIPSQWLWEEDQKLRALVKEYTFNWSLVSQQLSLPSVFVSGSGRRTPWECFERWVQLEGLPAEMSKTQYFRTYQGRLEQANKTVYAQFQAQQQQQQQQGQTPQPRRRPTTTPIRVERRRENRHLAIIDGMRKLARKRESAAHKQAESQKAAALRKAHEPAPPKSNVHTPQEFSRLKWEREEKLKQRHLQQEMLVRQQMAAQRQAQMQAQPGMANGSNQMQRNGTPGGNVNVATQMASTPSQQGQNGPAMAARVHPGQQGLPANLANGNMSNMAMGTPGVPQAQMQGNMQGAQRMGPPDQMRMAMQRGQFQNANQQHQFQLQQQQINMASNITQGMNMNGMPNANMMASLPNQNLNGNLNGNMNGNMNTAMNGMSNNAGSPRMNQGNANAQTPARPLSSGHMPQLYQIQNQLKQQFPEWTPEHLHKMASDQLARFLAKQRAQAMNAAAGASGMSPSPQMGNNNYIQQNGGMANNPQPNAVQNYQQQLVQQQRLMSQQQRQQAGSPGLNARPPSRSATPQNPQMQQSPGLQQAQINRS
ncbi:RNA polymerase II transcription elongation factor SpEAF [Neocucurbitaria cava]|uniref:Vacuolar import and degradation protein 21 n=1 Tax=Neocucurbitaria cava TaxID=798079 RepID=A0A9W8Y8Y5_9PLEO|nr:RNA polymerase II transcription elongation factor SpEAF [Neocucurbitaria cava]